MPPPPPEVKLVQGTMLVGKYRVTREIGRGGMAAVYEAVNVSLNKKVAVKVLASELSASTIVTERFFREARAAAAIKSPYIVEIYDSDRLEDGRPFICMELLEGESLYDRMARVRIIDVDTTVSVISDCAKGLAKAHAAGIVHRDLKPENIFLMIGDDGREIAKLLDFGLAKFYAPISNDEKSPRLTREGAVFGTPAYMSPEQVKGQGTVDHRADLWALGCLAFECLIGRPVWNTDQGVAMIFAAVATSAVPIPSKQRSDLPPAFDAWFAKALARNPDHRFQDARELAESLAHAFGKAGISMVSANELMAARAPSRSNIVAHPSNAFLSTANDTQPMDSLPEHSPPPTAHEAAPRPPAPSLAKWIGTGALLVAGMSSAAYVAARIFVPQVAVPTVVSSATADIAPLASSSEPPKQADDPPAKWTAAFLEGQRAFGTDLVLAQKKLKEAVELGAGASARELLDQARFASTSKDPCRLVAFGHPRPSSTASATRPSLALLKKGTLVAWSDSHEQAGHDHVYGVVVDASGTSLSKPRDLTPEADDVSRPSLLSSDEGAILLYANRRGSEAGIRIRIADGDGRIGGPSLLVAAAQKGSTLGLPAIERAPDGFWIAWSEERKEHEDLYLRKLNARLEATTPEIRATDYAEVNGKPVRVKLPSLAVASNALLLTFRLEREKDRHIYRMRMPLPLLKGLDDKPAKTDRVLGESALVNEDKLPSDSPSIGCGSEGCFIAWRGEKGGAFAAMIEPKEGKVLWRTKLAEKGSFPTVAVGSDAQVRIAYFDGNKLKFAAASRDGVQKPGGGVAKVVGDAAPPTVIAGERPGEWSMAWLDREGDHSEVFFGKVQCR